MHTKVIKAIQDNKLVFFIGSGFSRSLGFPNWSMLIEDFIDELSIDNPDLKILKELVASKHFTEMEILDKLHSYKPDIYKIMDEKFSIVADNDTTRLLNKQRKIGEISSKIITTNYDRALELANPELKKIIYNNKFQVANIDSNYIYKLHGCIEDPTNCILFKEDYDKLYNDSTNKSSLEELKKIIGDNTIIFLGFSLSDPYVKEQFSYINKIYDGLKGKHFLVSTESDSVTDLSNVENLKIDNWDDGLENLLEDMIQIKRQAQSKNREPLLVENLPSPAIEEEQKIAILIADPINKDFKYNEKKLSKTFNNMEVCVDFYHFNVATLNRIEGYKYVLIFTNTLNNRIYIEDEFLLSKLITLENLQSELFNENINCLFIFSDVNELQTKTPLRIPIILTKYNEKTINSFIFKTFRKADKTNLIHESLAFNEDKLTLQTIPQGKAKFTYNKTNLPSEIERKKLINFTGRVSDLENIIRKTLELNGQLLTIKASGGIGKTTIAKKVAIALADRGHFTEGIHFVDCEFISNFKSFELKIAQCFDLDRTINLKEHMNQNLSLSNKLIIIDNVESLLYLEDAEEVKELIEFICDFATILTTSRQWIDFEYEDKYELRAMTTDECVVFFQKYYKAEIDSNGLKILRSDIIENLLNNNPLAIKIITTNIPNFKSMEALKKDLEEDFFNTTKLGYEDIFVEDVDNNLEKSKSLYQSINYSYSKLSKKEKLVFELLSLFPNGINVQNFLNMFKSKNYKNDANRVTDKEIKSLENKSLLQGSNTHINLQSIVGRFATHKFSERNIEEKRAYYTKAFEFNQFTFNYIEQLEDKNMGVEIFDTNMENIFNTLNYLEYSAVEDKWFLLKFVNQIVSYSVTINNGKKYVKQLENLKEFFSDLERSDLLIDVLIYRVRFYEGDFNKSLSGLQKLLPFNEASKLIDSDEIVDDYIHQNSMGIYRYGRELQLTHTYIDKGIRKEWWIYNFHLLFTLGAYDFLLDYKIVEIQNMTINENNHEFFALEVLYNTNNLDVNSLNKLIDKKFKKDHLTLMQLHYIKAKMGEVDKQKIKKLVVVNPYTVGLKSLMLAFIEHSPEKTIILYETAITNLEHIKYYYVEAIYYYASYLKDKDPLEYSFWLDKGVELAKLYQYGFLSYMFDSLKISHFQPYIEEKYLPNLDLEPLKLIFNSSND